MNLTRDQIETYWRKRLDGQRLSFRGYRMAVKCVLHEDTHPSATVWLDGNSGYNCNGCGRKGNLFQFEAMFSKCDLDQAERNIAGITGARANIRDGWRQVAVFDYRDAEGHVVFQKRRLEHETEGKRFVAYRPEGAGWKIGIDGTERTKRVLYNLPVVVTANVVCLCEGEGKADVLEALSLFPDSPQYRVAATCNFDGAWKPEQSPKWLEEYNKYFAGKFVLIFEDNDAPGQTWAEHIAGSIYGTAAGVKLIRLPGLAESGDVKDWMQEHTVEQLREEIKRAARWRPEAKGQAQRVFIQATRFINTVADDIEWWVEGVIQKGANGMIVGEPGSSKSFVAADLSISLATGTPWLDCKVTEPIRVGYCAREDNPALTSWRLRNLLMGKGMHIDLSLFEQNLWINSRQQTPQLLLNDEAQVQELICSIQEHRLQMVFLDVFSVLHNVNENKSEEIAPILENCRRIQREAGCSIGLVHHFNKTSEGSITRRTRGTSSLGGFAEWMLGVEVDHDTKMRTVTFGKVKAGQEAEPISFVIEDKKQGWVKMKVLDRERKEPSQVKPNGRDHHGRDGKAAAAGGYQ